MNDVRNQQQQVRNKTHLFWEIKRGTTWFCQIYVRVICAHDRLWGTVSDDAIFFL